ncbi:MAG: ComF family protein, partial [Bacteroidota bacterium]
MSRITRDALSGLLDLLYPPVCLHCQVRTSGTLLCGLCRRTNEYVPEEATERLLERLGDHHIDQAVAVWYFDKGSPLQAVQHGLKYGNRPRCGEWMGAHLGRTCVRRSIEPDLAVPIPLHRTRLLERGYNQSAVIAESAAAVLRVPCNTDVLRRIRATISQTSLTRAERQTNLSGAFTAFEESAVAGKHVLLVDDVMTTGATLEAAARVL